MKEDSISTSQDKDRKDGKNHAIENPRADKNLTDHKNGKVNDQRHLIREENSNNFTNRSPDHNQ